MNDALEQALGIWRDVILPVAKKQKMELTHEMEFRAPPLVLLLGNHSSGKSSLINHLLGDEIQRTGVAPTDDGFTFLFRGEGEILDGETLSSRPDLPFANLRRFGPGLLRHLRAIPLKNPLLEQIWLVDSPGMIDAGGESQRPYDFGAVVRSLSEQADLILLLFDPEKPGTTGETLQVLTRYLGGMEDRLRIVMNKMDLFSDLRDFARAYGALCWNLSRSIKSQDLPHIYTTSLPGRGGLSPESFQAALEDLGEDIKALPARRGDSRLTRMLSEARKVHMRAEITEAFRSRLKEVKLKSLGIITGLALFCGLGWSLTQAIVQPDSHVGAHLLWFAISLFLLGGSGLFAHRWIRQVERYLKGHLDLIFEETFKEAIAVGADELQHSWQSAKPGLERHLNSLGLSAFQKVRAPELRKLRVAIELDLPALRRQPSTLRGDSP